MTKELVYSFLIVLFGQQITSESLSKKQLFADVTSNKLTREHDGSFGLWSYHGTAKDSNASQTSFIYDADLLTPDGSRHFNIASTVYPALGLWSDQDAVFQEYLILQAKVTGIDGFFIEWGHMNHSSDRAFQSYINLATKYMPFPIGVNWLSHLLTEELKNKTSDEIVSAFHTNLQYLMDTLYNSKVGLYHDTNPVIFLFGGGITYAQFKELISLPLSLPPGAAPPIWIGNYENFAASPSAWAAWSTLLNGTFGWAPFVKKPTPANMSQWDYYGDTDDAVQYQENMTKFGDACLSSGKCAVWSGSVSPGFDNRGCAGWGEELRYIPRVDLVNKSRFTYDAQWDYYTTRNTSAEYLIIPTMNDFPEATPILPIDSSYHALYSTAKYASLWKGHSIDLDGVVLPRRWYLLYKEMQFYNRTPGISILVLEEFLQDVSKLINSGLLGDAHYYLDRAKKLLDEDIKLQLKEENISLLVPGPNMKFTVPPVLVNNSYLIHSAEHLYIAMSEKIASDLRTKNFKGLLRFQYQSLNQSLHFLRVVSSSQRHLTAKTHQYKFLDRGLRRNLKFVYNVEGNYSDVCNIMVDGSIPGKWHTAVVALYKLNQSWDHTLRHGADLIFLTDGKFLLRNISLDFTVLSKR